MKNSICHNVKLVKIKKKNYHWNLFFKNNESLFKLPIYRLSEIEEENFIDYKVGDFYNLKITIEKAKVEDIDTFRSTLPLEKEPDK